MRHRLRMQGLRRTRQRGEGRAFESLREYVAGDDPRTVDWKATARRAGLHVRQYEAERSQNVILAVDSGRLMMETLGDRDRLDHALSIALLLADIASVMGDRVGFMAFSDRIDHFLPPRRRSFITISEALATTDARFVESNYPLAFNYLRSRVKGRSLIILLTDVIDRAASAAMLSAVGRSAKRHLALAVALRNPELVSRADNRASSERDAYRRAAAEEMIEARATALATLRRSGALIADVTPDEAPAETINRYLEAKFRGLI